MDISNMDISKCTAFGFYLVSVVDKGKHINISVADIVSHIEGDTVFAFLEEQFGTNLCLSRLNQDDRKELSEEWKGLASAVSEKRKFDVENNGVCLLLAYTLQGIQSRLISEQKQSTAH